MGAMIYADRNNYKGADGGSNIKPRSVISANASNLKDKSTPIDKSQYSKIPYGANQYQKGYR
jgi:hypothetical protein